MLFQVEELGRPVYEYYCCGSAWPCSYNGLGRKRRQRKTLYRSSAASSTWFEVQGRRLYFDLMAHMIESHGLSAASGLLPILTLDCTHIRVRLMTISLGLWNLLVVCRRCWGEKIGKLRSS